MCSATALCSFDSVCAALMWLVIPVVELVAWQRLNRLMWFNCYAAVLLVWGFLVGSENYVASLIVIITQHDRCVLGVAWRFVWHKYLLHSMLIVLHINCYCRCSFFLLRHLIPSTQLHLLSLGFGICLIIYFNE